MNPSFELPRPQRFTAGTVGEPGRRVFFLQAYAVGEESSNAGGLLRWPIKLVVPAGFVMLALQGVSEVIKRAAALCGRIRLESRYERPLQ